MCRSGWPPATSGTRVGPPTSRAHRLPVRRPQCLHGQARWPPLAGIGPGPRGPSGECSAGARCCCGHSAGLRRFCLSTADPLQSSWSSLSELPRRVTPGATLRAIGVAAPQEVASSLESPIGSRSADRCHPSNFNGLLAHQKRAFWTPWSFYLTLVTSNERFASGDAVRSNTIHSPSLL